MTPPVFAAATPAVDQLDETSDFLNEVYNEIGHAREHYPGAKHMLAALVEEVGELAAALLEGQSYESIRAEAVQVAAMACRVAVDGDEDFGTPPQN